LFRRDFKALAELRVKESAVLAHSGNQAGAYYLAGYAVECALKASIAKRTKRFEFPPPRELTQKLYSHDLVGLLKQAGLERDLEKAMKKNPALAANWNTVKNWNEATRYVSSGLNGKDLHVAVAGADGVLQWIKQYW
jgi:HEPN domain-containing protein